MFKRLKETNKLLKDTNKMFDNLENKKQSITEEQYANEYKKINQYINKRTKEIDKLYPMKEAIKELQD